MSTYKVEILIRGSMVRPSYEGYVEVRAENDQDAEAAAIRKLRYSGVWNDVSSDSFVVQSVTRVRRDY